MSSFKCEKCGKEIIDSPQGYVTECEHYPLEMSKSIAKRIRAQMGVDGKITKE